MLQVKIVRKAKYPEHETAINMAIDEITAKGKVISLKFLEDGSGYTCYIIWSPKDGSYDERRTK